VASPDSSRYALPASQAPSQAELAGLRAGLDHARTPGEFTHVLDVAAAIADRASRYRRSLLNAELVDAARDAYHIGIDATFARLEAMCRIADQLPGGQGERTDLSDRPTSSHFGISRDTAARWKRYREIVEDLDLDAVKTTWANKADGDPKGWEEPTITRVVYRRAEPVETPPPPDGRYRTIVADPPWPMTRIMEFGDEFDGLAYPTMTVDEIAALPVADWADDNCHVYLWVTHHHLPDGLAILDAWGARYSCVLTWCKNGGMTPYAWTYNTEHILFARVGNLAFDRIGLPLSFNANRSGHSIKPDVFYERVMAASPGPRLEMFARRERPGFVAWGAEALT
jgi:N6-adenosine-specific RNA methylase IME4